MRFLTETNLNPMGSNLRSGCGDCTPVIQTISHIKGPNKKTDPEGTT